LVSVQAEVEFSIPVVQSMYFFSLLRACFVQFPGFDFLLHFPLLFSRDIFHNPVGATGLSGCADCCISRNSAKAKAAATAIENHTNRILI
jgi:hypothetical protein